MAAAGVAIFGGGPAGLMAADRLSAAGHAVTVYEAMPTVGRKFLLAGKSGLNLTHAEGLESFLGRYGEARAVLEQAVRRLSPDRLRQWADDLGAETFVGSSGRVFPKVMKASPLLRAWLKTLQLQGVTIHTRHRWLGMAAEGGHRIATPDGERIVRPKAALLAFGGASWPKLGSDGGWIDSLRALDVEVTPFRPANCGFERAWSAYFRERFAGAPVKSVTATSEAGTVQGEFVISTSGVEGSLIYAHSAALRDAIDRSGHAVLGLDLAPGRDRARLIGELQRQGGKASFSNRLRKAAGLDPVKIALLREISPDAPGLSAADLAHRIKALPLRLDRTRPIEEAISSAGGIPWSEIDERYMLRRIPGLFVAGEMIDWEAPTGGYLLTACLATGDAAASGIDAYLAAGA